MTKKIVSINPQPRRSQEAQQSATPEQWVAGGGGGRLKRFTVELDPGLHRRLRMVAARDGRTMAEIVRDLIEVACPE